MSSGKIDTHNHFLPKFYVDAVGSDLLNAAMPNGKAPDWSLEAALGVMDQNGIDEAVLSISAGPPIPDAPILLRRCNEHAAELRAQNKGRFGSFASLPLPDVDASLAEVGHALDVLGADGFILFTSYEGRYLGDELFHPLYEELDRRKAVVLVHPNQPPYAIPAVAPASVLEFPFETTRTATSLIIAGVMNRYKNIKFILSHAGGTLPFLVPRISLSISMMPPAVIERVGDTQAAFRAFYYDTALSGGAAPMAALLQIADPDHILFGTDFPFAPVTAIPRFTEALERVELPGFDKAAVFRTNAARLLGRG